MRKLLVGLSVAASAISIASGAAVAARPLPPVQPSPPVLQLVVSGVLGNYVAPTATANGSVDVTVTFPGYRFIGPSLQRLTVVLTPQTSVVGGPIADGEQATLRIVRQASPSGPSHLVALQVVVAGTSGIGHACPVQECMAQ